MKNSKGVSLVESLIACWLLMFVITFVLPQLYFITIERKNLLIENIARKTLSEKLFEQSISLEPNLSEIVLYERIPLQINIEMDIDSKLYKGCVNWTDLLNREQTSCGAVGIW